METRFGSFEVCDRVVQLVLAKDVYVFYYNNIYWIPPGPMTRSSDFYDCLSPPLPPETPITVSTIASTAQDICKGHNG